MAQAEMRHTYKFLSSCLVLFSDITGKMNHTCDIFLEPDREIWDFSEGDWGLR